MRRLYPFFVLLVAAGIGVWTLVAGGRDSTAFLVLATIALGWVVWLLFRIAESLVKDQLPVDGAVATGRRRKELEREKAALLKALKELEFDHQMGKVSDKDFADIGAQYRARAIRVLRQLDEGSTQYDALIAKEIAARLKKAAAPAAAVTLTAEVRPAATVSEPERAAAPGDGRISCAGCGTPNDGDAEFCKKCGSRLTASQAAP